MSKLKKILLIDDDTINNFIVLNKLNNIALSLDAVSVLNGREGLDYLNKCILENLDFPELILLDINMPVLDGWGFLDEFEKLEKNYQQKTAIYMVSSSVYIEDIEKAKEYSQIKQFISKPLSKDKLTEIIQSRIQKI